MKIVLFLTSLCLLTSAAFGSEKPQHIFSRLTGKPLTLKHPQFAQINELSNQGRYEEVAQLIIDSELPFYDNVVRDFATRMLNVDENPFGEYNDAVAMVIGVTKFNKDAREMLRGDFIYAPIMRVSGVAPSTRDNQAFSNIVMKELSPSQYLKEFSPQWNSSRASISAGILTTRGWAETYYKAGTNRRAVVGTFNAFLCSPIAKWRRQGLPDFRVRRDIDRNPSGNPKNYQVECRSCHAPMDAMAGAFSLVDFNSSSELVFSLLPSNKYNQNSNVYPEGFITDDDSWINMLASGGSDFGWRGPSDGQGLKEFGEMIGNSSGFSRCMAFRAYRQVCHKSLELSDLTVLDLAADFEKSGYKFQELFKKAVLHETCFN